jgi:hypothetical protein
MRHLLHALVVGAVVAATTLPLHANAQATAAAAIQLRGGLTQADADTIIATVKDAQEKLRNGENVYFELLSGAPASYDQTRIAPRDAFLALSFDAPFSLSKLAGDRLWQPYRFEITGDQSLVSQVDVILGSGDRLERIEILTRPPHPF